MVKEPSCAVTGGLGEGGVGGVEFDVSAGDGAVLGVVDDSVNLTEDGGVDCVCP